MSNPENLEGYRFGDDKRSASEQREIQRKGGINSGKARRTKRNAKVLLNQMPAGEIKDLILFWLLKTQYQKIKDLNSVF